MLNKITTKRTLIRKENVGVRFNRQELDKIENMSEAEGTRVATWIRIVILKELRKHKG